jgi:hypothetical protein
VAGYETQQKLGVIFQRRHASTACLATILSVTFPALRCAYITTTLALIPQSSAASRRPAAIQSLVYASPSNTAMPSDSRIDNFLGILLVSKTKGNA